jgi:vacuolar-type H+-ATPase subunit I/STV1
MTDEPGLRRGEGSERYPVPDPTTLTTEALRREVAALQALIEQRLSSLKELLLDHISTIENRIDLRHETARAEYATMITAARDYCNNQFGHVNDELQQVERLRVEQKKDVKDAVDAALAAQKEAIAKSETATTKQIDQLAITANTARDELRRGIDDAKERISDVERTLRTSIAEVDNKANAINNQARGGEASRAAVWGWLAAAVAVIGLVVVLANVVTGS